jgi:hypothetical protein
MYRDVERSLGLLDPIAHVFLGGFQLPALTISINSGESRVRALVVRWNCCPSSPQTMRKHAGQVWPAERLSGKRYADNWLEN